MKVYENPKYQEDISYISNLDLPWDQLKNCSVLLSGASGMIGSCVIDVIMHLNLCSALNCIIYALSRNEESARERFAYCWEDPRFHFISHDINQPVKDKGIKDVDYVIHLASNSHPIAYAGDPIGTVTTNIIGAYNMLEFAAACDAKRTVFASSNEIYGENRGDVEFFDENYCGYIDPNTLRADYTESKRCGEALCQAYRRQKGLNVVIPRLTRSYGPTMLMSDTKASSQFIRNAISGEDIALKSAGTQYYSYTYVTDAVSGLLTVLLKGTDGEAYNIADESGDISLKDLAKIIADYTNLHVIYKVPDEAESAGYSTATKARLSGEKLKRLGWRPKYDIKNGIERTISILQELN